MCLWWIAQPDSDGGDVDCAAVDEVTFVIASGDCPGLAELVDGALDDVAGLVGLLVEARWAAALAAAPAPPGDLVGLARDRGLDVAGAQRRADLVGE